MMTTPMHEFPSDLSWKIFLDRYTQKDPHRAFVPGDLAIAVITPDPKWPKKDIGRVLAVDGETLTLALLTGPQAGETLTRSRTDCDRPLEQTLTEVAERIGRGIAQVESPERQATIAQQFADEIAALRWVPGGRIWAGAGTDQQLTYFNCYVLGCPHDSREGIVETLGQMIEIMSRGGGVGINVSSLRPAHAVLQGVNGRSSGAVSWMDLYSRATGLVEQGGCFAPEVRIATTQGLIPANTLFDRIEAGETFKALTHEGPRRIVHAFHNGRKPLWRVTTAQGLSLEITQDHKLSIPGGPAWTTVPLRALHVGDSILVHEPTALSNPTIRPFSTTITAIEPSRIDEVYDFEVEHTHLLSGNGFYTSNSRRGALMLQLEDWHPDLPKFIAIKQTPGMAENANISVRVSDDFMAAVKADRDWGLVFPDTQDPDYDTLWDGNLETWKAAGKPVIVYETLKARELWQQLIAGAWAAAEPGIVFDQRHENESNSWYFNPLVCTNPCVIGETRVATNEGLVPIRELAQCASTPDLILDSRRSQSDAQAPLVSAWFTGIRPVMTITTREGYHVRCTPDHRIRTTNGWCPAEQLTPGTEILLLNRGGAFGNQGSEDLGRTLGWLIGDGTIKSDRAVLSFFHEKQSLADTMAHSVNRLIRPAVNHRDYVVHPIAVGQTEQRVSSTRFREIADQHGLIPNKLQVPEIIFRSTESCQRAFLQALFSADGTVSHHVKTSRTIRLTSISCPLLEQVQQLLLNFQIVSRIYDNRRSGRTTSQLPDGHGGHRAYPVKPLYELEVSKDNLQRFQQRIGFLLDSKQTTLQTVLASYVHGPQTETFTAHVASVVPEGAEAVYDLTESITHSFSANGLIISNCAEQPLPAWGGCTLGHVNLAQFVDANRQDVDWDALRRTVHTGVRFLDNVVDATPYFYEENRVNQQRERRIGLGTMGLGELLIRLGYRYGSPESLAFIDRLFGFIAQEAYLYDTVLAKEKGTFPAFDAEKLLQSGFMQRMPESVREAIRQHGLRNVTLLTQAPTGTVGTMVGTSTGIEPFYALTYFRQSRLGFDQQYVDVAREWLDAHPNQSLPDYFVGAMDLTPEEHVQVQAAIQAWTDSSISKTANAPSTYTVEDTARLYELAYDLRCKGVTIYRDQSRQEQVLHLTSDADEPTEPSVVPLDNVSDPTSLAILPVPSTITGTTYRKETPAGTARVVINTEDGSPFEVFLLLGRAGSEVQSFMEALGRIISLHLRTPGPVPATQRLAHIADQLRGIGGANQMGFGPQRVLSVVDAIGQVLQHAQSAAPSADLESAVEPSPSETPIAVTADHPLLPSTNYDLCPQCSAISLVYEEGCQHCVACGYSKC